VPAKQKTSALGLPGLLLTDYYLQEAGEPVKNPQLTGLLPLISGRNQGNAL
jgi:hypothetical protein